MPRARNAGFQDPTEDAGVRLLAGVERIALCGRFPAIGRHRHAAAAVVVGIDGPLTFLAEGAHHSRAALLAPGFTHAVETRGGRIAVFVLPSHAAALPGAQGRSSEAPVRDLPKTGSWVELGLAVLERKLHDLAPVDALLTREVPNLRPIDDRLRSALHALEDTLDRNTPVAQIAAAARVSPSRLMALAREQLGTSLRSYRRWLRAFQVARDYAAGCSLTAAALKAGFASSAHLSVAAREHFGIRPSDILTPANRHAIRTV